MTRGCDLFKEHKRGCYFAIRSQNKKNGNLHRGLKPGTPILDDIYILQCATPQENVLKSSDVYLNTLEGEVGSKIEITIIVYRFFILHRLDNPKDMQNVIKDMNPKQITFMSKDMQSPVFYITVLLFTVMQVCPWSGQKF